MKNNDKKLPTAEELRFAAKTMAYRIAENCGIDPDTVRHMRDDDYDKPCFVVTADAGCAVLVYECDPATKFTILNRPGRLQPIEQSVIPVTDKVDQ